MAEKRLRVKISGFVQGIFYRSFCQQEAEELELKGFVKNQVDGSVLVEAEGEEANLKEFIEILKTGPRSAKVEKIETEWFETQNQFKDFQIKY